MSDLLYLPAKGTALFRVKTKKRLAELLITKPSMLKTLTNSDGLYKCWKEPKQSGGVREIEAPYPHLKDVQKRIADLLKGIAPPDYLMAPVRNRSYVTNGSAHIGSKAFCLLDIEDFFPSCTEKKVFWFFNKCMECSADVSAILASIACRNGRLPQGSPCSPFLAFYAYIDMWEDIADVCKASSNKITIYADDITISGDVVPTKSIWKIKTILVRHGHQYKRQKERSVINKKVEVTGVIVSSNTLLLPNRQHKKLKDTKTNLDRATNRPERLSLQRKLRGRIAQSKQVLSIDLDTTKL